MNNSRIPMFSEITEDEVITLVTHETENIIFHTTGQETKFLVYRKYGGELSVEISRKGFYVRPLDLMHVNGRGREVQVRFSSPQRILDHLDWTAMCEYICRMAQCANWSEAWKNAADQVEAVSLMIERLELIDSPTNPSSIAISPYHKLLWKKEKFKTLCTIPEYRNVLLAFSESEIICDSDWNRGWMSRVEYLHGMGILQREPADSKCNYIYTQEGIKFKAMLEQACVIQVHGGDVKAGWRSVEWGEEMGISAEYLAIKKHYAKRLLMAGKELTRETNE